MIETEEQAELTKKTILISITRALNELFSFFLPFFLHRLFNLTFSLMFNTDDDEAINDDDDDENFTESDDEILRDRRRRTF